MDLFKNCMMNFREVMDKECINFSMHTDIIYLFSIIYSKNVIKTRVLRYNKSSITFL